MRPHAARTMLRSPLRTASVQFESRPRDKHANLSVIEHFVRRAADERAQLVVFPECCITGYWFIRNLTTAELEQLAEPVPHGPSVRKLIELARTHHLTIGAGLIERDDDGFYNTYVIALPDGTIHKHRKLHAFEHAAIRSGSTYTI